MRRQLAVHARPLLGGLAAFAILALAAILYAGTGGAREHLVIVLVVNIIMVVGTQMFAGNSGILSFGHVGFAAIASYVSAILSAPPVVKAIIIPHAPLGLAAVQLPVPLAMLVAILFTTMVAAVIGLAISRLQGLAASIVTLAMLIVISSVLTNWKDLTGGAEAFYGIPLVTTLRWALLGCLVTVLAGRLFKASRLGLRVRAGREDELAAGSMGVNVVRSRYAAWVLSAAFASLGGVLLTHLLGAVNPSQFYFNLMFVQLAMLVLGGLYSVTGAIAGVVVVTIGSELARYFGDGPLVLGQQLPVIHGLSLLFQGLVILVVMLWRPGGLLDDSEIEDVWRWKKGSRSAAQLPVLPVIAAGADAAPPHTSRPMPTPDVAVGLRPEPIASDPVLSVLDVVVVFKGLRAVDGASLEVRPGEIVGLIGPNGAGKTTLLNVISGVIGPTSGDVVLSGSSIRDTQAFRIARLGVARTFQNVRLFQHLTVRENVEVTASVAAQYRALRACSVDELLEQFDLVSVADRNAGTLPYGRQREVEMARAVALGPDLLLLDEPAAGTNDAESMELAAAVRKVRDIRACAVLLIDHDLHFVLTLCDRIYVLDAGVIIAAGRPDEIQRDPRVIEAYLGSRSLDQKYAGEAEASPPFSPALGL